MSKKIRILQVLNSLGIGGNPIFVMNYFRTIDKEKFQVDFLIFESKLDFYNEVVAEKSNVYICPYHSQNKIKDFILKIKFVREVLKDHSYDVVHCHSCSFWGLFRGVIPARIHSKAAVISHSHNVGKTNQNFVDKFVRCVCRICLRPFIDYGFACSDFAGASKYTKHFMKSNKYKVIHNAINVEKYQFDRETRNSLREKYNVPEDAVVIGTVGRLASIKNQSFLLDIFSCILKKKSNAYLIIVGDGELMEVLRNKAKKLQIDTNVIFTGASLQAEKYYSMMDVFVLTSIYEGLGLVLIEAQTSGLPCFASDGVPVEAKITEKFEYVSLKLDGATWAKKILDVRQNLQREMAYFQVKNSSYDLRNECKILEDYYIKCKQKELDQ